MWGQVGSLRPAVVPEFRIDPIRSRRYYRFLSYGITSSTYMYSCHLLPQPQVVDRWSRKSILNWISCLYLVDGRLWDNSVPQSFSRLPQVRINHPRHNLAVPVGKGVAIPSSGERPEPFSQMAFIGNGTCRSIQHTRIAHQSMSKGSSHTKTGIIYR